MATPQPTISPTDYVLSKGWPHRVSGNQLVLDVCPLCNTDGRHFYINVDTGLWDCKKCNANGNLFTLLREQGDLQKYVPGGSKKEKVAGVVPEMVAKYHEALLSPAGSAGLTFLRNRGFTLETIKKFQLGWRDWGAIGGCIGYPIIASGRCWFIKWRTVTGAKTFRREPEGALSVLFNQDVVTPGSEIILTEGEADAIALVQAGFPNAVSVTNGASSTTTETVQALKRAKKIFLAYDPDPAGKAGIEKLARAVGMHKCWEVPMPQGLDVNDLINIRGPKEFQKLLDDARQMGTPSILTAEQVYERHLVEVLGSKDALLTGFEPWDEIVGPLRPGNMYVLCSHAGGGKTTLAHQLTYPMAERGRIVWNYCLELSDTESMEVLIQHKFKTRALCDIDWAKGYAAIQKTGMRFFPPENAGNWREQLESMAGLVREGGVEVLVVDNFNFFTRSCDGNSYEVEGVASKELKRIAAVCKIPVIVLQHPRKASGEYEEEPNAQTLRGSYALVADASSVVVLHRPLVQSAGDSDMEREAVGVLKSAKSRWGSGGKKMIHFEGETATFRKATYAEAEGYKEKHSRKGNGFRRPQ